MQLFIGKTIFLLFMNFHIRNQEYQDLFKSISLQQLKIPLKFSFKYTQLFRKMEQVSKQQIVCIFDNDESTPIFDKDQWESEALNVDTAKQIPLEQNSKADRKMIERVNEEIQKTKQSFFKVNVIKKTSEHPLLTSKTSKTQNVQNSSVVKLQSINEKNKNTVLIEGYLNKRTDGFFVKWHKRYAVLTSQKLYFFTCQNKYQVIGCVNLKLLPTKIKETDNAIVLDFLGECQNMIIKAESENDRKVWKAWLEKVVDYQGKQNKVMIKTIVKPLYDSKDTIAQKQFIQTAETGDILLFYTKNTGAQLQRLFTNSDFDHVAMVVKFRKNDLMVFESNQIYGVSIYDWRQYIQYFDLYQKITVRKLEYIKKADAQRQILSFVKKNLGKNYEINFSKLVTLESDVNWDMINKEKNKERGYFCSELIAKALKSVGLLDEKKSSGRYWPVDFAEKSGLMLKKGASLGREQVIILNKHLKNYI